MSLTFTALPVPEGDAFLLEDGDRKYLFDSGGNQDEIKRLLKGKKINKIDVAICSHNDSDHSRGFIGLLKKSNNPIAIDEIWLPVIWCSIVKFVIDNKDDVNVWSDIENNLLKEYSDENSTEWDDYDIDELFFKEFTYNPAKTGFLDDIKEIDISLTKNSSKPCEFVKFSRKHYDKDLVDKLNNIIRIVSLAIQKGCKIVWFKNLKSPYTPYINIYGFIPINSIPVCVVKSGVYPINWGFIPIILSKQLFIKVLNLTEVNHFSLVFEFWKENIPVVRFSADSDCDFQTYNPYKDSIIITAAHHGSDTNSTVFKGIKGCDITWVRTYHRKVKVGCAEFLKRPIRYCVKCPHKNVFQEIHFEYQSGKWQPKSGILCKCK